MNIPQEKPDAAKITQPICNDADNSSPVPTKETASSLVLPELQIWDYIGNQRIKDLNAITEAMDTIREAALAILKGEPRRRHVRRVEKLAALSKDNRYQRLIRALLVALREGDHEGVRAAASTAAHIESIATTTPVWKPEYLDEPWYPKHGVWQPGSKHRRGKAYPLSNVMSNVTS